MKKFFATMLSLLMIVGMLPVAVLAVETGTDPYEGYNVVKVTKPGELRDRIANVTQNTKFELADGTYTITTPKDLNFNSNPINIAFTGSKDVVFNISAIVYAHGLSFTFDGVTVAFPETTDYTGLAHINHLTYKNCTINGKQTLYSPQTVFDNCTFENKKDYCIWTWAASNGVDNEITFTDCIFYTGGKCINVYNDSTYSLLDPNSSYETTVNLTNCIFYDDDSLDTVKAAIETGSIGTNTETGNRYTLNLINCIVNGFAVNDEGTNTDTTLWGNKHALDDEHLIVNAYHYLSFETNGGTKIVPALLRHGIVDVTDYTPEKYGYNFTGWYTDATLQNRITEIPLTKPTTLYAGWSMTNSYRYSSFFSDLALLFAQTFEIESTATEGGSISPEGITYVRYDRNQTYTITPAEGYEIASVLVDGEEVGPVTSYTFKRVKENGHTIEAVFELIEAAAEEEPA